MSVWCAWNFAPLPSGLLARREPIKLELDLGDPLHLQEKLSSEFIHARRQGGDLRPVIGSVEASRPDGPIFPRGPRGPLKSRVRGLANAWRASALCSLYSRAYSVEDGRASTRESNAAREAERAAWGRSEAAGRAALTICGQVVSRGCQIGCQEQSGLYVARLDRSIC